MSRPSVVTKQLDTADDNGIAESQTPLAAGNLTLTTAAGVTLDTQRRVLITSAADDSARTWTVEGTNDAGEQIRDSFAGANGTSYSNLDFKTVTKISVDDATAGAVIAGTNGVGSTPWQMLSTFNEPFSLALALEVLSGTVVADIELTYDEFAVGIGTRAAFANRGVDSYPTAFKHPSLQGVTANQMGSFDAPITGWRLLVTSGTGEMQASGIQSGI